MVSVRDRPFVVFQVARTSRAQSGGALHAGKVAVKGGDTRPACQGCTQSGRVRQVSG